MADEANGDNDAPRRHRTTESNNREYLEARIDGAETLNDERWTSHERAHREHAAAHDREHIFTQQAISTAAELAKENKADANEWRGSMNDRERNFATKAELGNTTAKVETLERAEIKRAENEQARRENEAEDKADADRRQRNQQWFVGIAAAIGAVLVNLVIQLLSEAPVAQ